MSHPAGLTTSGASSKPSTKPGKLTVLLFASASTYASNLEQITLPAPQSLRSVLRYLESRFPGFREKVLRSCAITVNLVYVNFDPDDLDEEAPDADTGDGLDGEDDSAAGEGLDLVVKKGDEVGIIPPVSSG